MLVAERTRSLDLSRVRRHFQKMSGRQTNIFFLKKTLEIVIYIIKNSFLPFSDIKYALKSLKNSFVTDGLTDGPTDQPKSGL